LDAQLGSLQSAIEDVRSVDYASILAELDATVLVVDRIEDPVLRRLLRDANREIEAQLNFVASTNDLTPAERFLALHNISAHQRTVDLVATTSDLTRAEQRLALEQASETERTIRLALQSDLTRQEKELVLAEANEVTRQINVALGSGLSRADRDLLLDTLAARSRTIRQVLQARIDDSRISEAQHAFLEALTSARGGKLLLGGSFEWDPSKSFSAWYEQTTKGNIQAPLDALRGSLTEVRSALVLLAQTIQAEVAAKLLAEQKAKALADAQAALEAAALARTTAGTNAKAAVDAIAAFDNAHGGYLSDSSGRAQRITLNPDGTLNYNGITGVTYSSASQLEAWRQNFWNAGGLEDQAQAAAQAQRLAEEALQKARQQVIDLGGVPAFRRGGHHPGGLRIVGENGPEIEATGPSRIFSATQTSQMLRESGMNPEVVRELKQIRKDQKMILTQLLQSSRKTSRLHEQWEGSGLPPARATL